jgi:hypothetical protein
MKTLSIKSIIEFRDKSDKSKKTFSSSLKSNKVKAHAEGGGDYWITCLSAISSSFKSVDLKFVIDKRVELEEKYDAASSKRTKTMYKRNIDILYNYEDFDLKKWRPTKKLTFLKKYKANSILTIKGLPVQATPHHIFTFKNNEVEEIGAIWFIAKLNGFESDELGMFADCLYRYLKKNFSKEFEINPKYCIAVDVFNRFDVNYSQMENGEIPLILNSTLDDINKWM